MKNSYQTPARRALTALFESYPHRQFTAEQICTLLCETNEGGTALKGKSTVYRQLGKLCEQGKLRRFEGRDSSGGAVSLYQYAEPDSVCDTHFHLKCIKCARVFHFDNASSDALLALVADKYGFSVDSGRSMLCGVCAECSEKEKTKK